MLSEPRGRKTVTVDPSPERLSRVR